MTSTQVLSDFASALASGAIEVVDLSAPLGPDTPLIKLPPEIGQDIMAYIGCIAGAILVTDYERQLREAGFAAVQVIDTGKDLNAYAKVENQSACCPPTIHHQSACCGAPSEIHDGLAELLRKYNVNDFAASVQVYALKRS